MASTREEKTECSRSETQLLKAGDFDRWTVKN